MMQWIELNEIVDARDKDQVKTKPVIVKVDSINTVKQEDCYGIPSSLIGLQNDSIWVTETGSQILDLCHG